jgi:hypothetical protein
MKAQGSRNKAQEQGTRRKAQEQGSRNKVQGRHKVQGTRRTEDLRTRNQLELVICNLFGACDLQFEI